MMYEDAFLMPASDVSAAAKLLKGREIDSGVRNSSDWQQFLRGHGLEERLLESELATDSCVVVDGLLSSAQCSLLSQLPSKQHPDNSTAGILQAARVGNKRTKHSFHHKPCTRVTLASSLYLITFGFVVSSR